MRAEAYSNAVLIAQASEAWLLNQRRDVERLLCACGLAGVLLALPHGFKEATQPALRASPQCEELTGYFSGSSEFRRVC